MASVQQKLAVFDNLLQEKVFPGQNAEKDLWHGVLELCQTVADSLTELEEAQDDLTSYIETIDDDLSALEGRLYGSGEDDDEEDPAYLDLNLTCPHCRHEFHWHGPTQNPQ